jgi:hypothetical protein
VSPALIAGVNSDPNAGKVQINKKITGKIFAELRRTSLENLINLVPPVFTWQQKSSLN